MKLALLMALASAVLFLAPTAAGAAQGEQGAGTSGQTLMKDANESAQATTDVPLGGTGQNATPAAGTVGYGGVATGRSEAGGGQSRPCGSGSQCRIYFGR
ncbi:hypothetical protein ACOCG7_08820 [Paraburkholderia sp. DD10]|uniref:hypothetical protein n=1 Tax=Paraburkholderia TaxID=1822464 RepID=UPI00321820B6